MKAKMVEVEIGLKTKELLHIHLQLASKIFGGYVLQLGNLYNTMFMMAVELTMNMCSVGDDDVFLLVAMVV
jgi:hypothetical protein